MQCIHTGGMEVQLHTFLTSTQDEGDWSATRPWSSALPPTKLPLDTHWIWWWEDPETVSTLLKNRKFLSGFETWIIQPVAYKIHGLRYPGSHVQTVLNHLPSDSMLEVQIKACNTCCAIICQWTVPLKYGQRATSSFSIFNNRHCTTFECLEWTLRIQSSREGLSYTAHCGASLPRNVM